jgi:hypothetical protein
MPADPQIPLPPLILDAGWVNQMIQFPVFATRHT